MQNNYDIIIIGGGLLGCATAYQLAKRKAGNILLLESNEIASQASALVCLPAHVPNRHLWKWCRKHTTVLKRLNSC